MRLPTAPAPACHPAPGAVVHVAGTPRIALAGSPNVGKSTLFNALTGASGDVGNYPGTTVALGQGSWRLPGAGRAELLDLPGAYSLDAQSPDEEVTRDVLLGEDAEARPDLVVVVVDAAHLVRSLLLLVRVRELPVRVVVALTMADVAERRGVHVDVDALAVAVGAPVVPLDPRRRRELAALGAAVESALAAPVPAPLAPPEPPAGAEGHEHDLAVAEARFDRAEAAASAALHRTRHVGPTLSDRIDAVATAPVIGVLAFLLVMLGVFEATTRLAAPLQGALGRLFDGPLTDLALGVLGWLGLDGTWVEGLVVDGLIAGVGMVLTFVPLMAIMFLLLALLEDSGYMARAAVVTDRLMRRLGLPGRAFLPLVVGFGCNVPAVYAARVLPHARQRLLVVLLVPFTSCTARLTVYVLVATVFFGSRAGLVVFGMYVLSIALVVAVGLALRRTLTAAVGDDPLVIDLPPYQVPAPRLLAGLTWIRLRGFLRSASGIIVATVIVVWALTATPAPGEPGSFGHVPVQESVYAATAGAIAPVFEPAGFGDWQATSALVVGFVAKEAVVSAWAQTLAAEEPADVSEPGQLGDRLRADFEESSGGKGALAALAFLVFLLAYTPCVATLAAQRREVGLRMTAFGIVMQLAVAWTLAVLVFQVGSALA